MANKILVIEDDEVLVKILEKIIISLGFEILWEYNVEDAIDTLKVETPKLILLDLNLGDQKGHRILEFREKKKDLRKVPVIVLTSSGARIDVILAKSRGAADYIIKPFNGNELVSRIQKALGN